MKYKIPNRIRQFVFYIPAALVGYIGWHIHQVVMPQVPEEFMLPVYAFLIIMYLLTIALSLIIGIYLVDMVTVDKTQTT